MAEVAAFARINELGGDMKTTSSASTMWALGDYHRFATQLVWEFGPVLVEACGISAGQRVLDVAAGTGNVAVRAAEAGADVVALDLTPENLEAGRRAALSRGIELEWVEGDAQALPFTDDEFDVVTSSAGAMFAPDHQAVADEMLRVCRSGGTIGMINFVPEGTGGEFFELLGRFAPPPPAGALPPILWGDQDHVRTLFGDGVASLDLIRRQYVETLSGSSRTGEDYVAFYKETFGPIIAIYSGLEPARRAEFDRDFLDFATRRNQGTPEAAEYHYDYLLVLAKAR